MLEDKIFKPGELTDEAIAAMLVEAEKMERKIDIRDRVRNFAEQSKVLIQNPNANYLVDLKIAYPYGFISIEPDTIDPSGGIRLTSFSVVFLKFRQIHADPKVIVRNLSSMATLRVFIMDASQDTQSYQSTIGPSANDDIWLDVDDCAIIVPSHFHSREIFAWKKAMGKLLMGKEG